MLYRLSVFLFSIKKLFHTYLFGLFLFFVSRLVFFIRVNNENLMLSHTMDLFKAFYTGAKFDTMVLMYGLVVPFILMLMTIFIKTSSYQSFVYIFSKYFISFILIVFSLILIIDIFYFDFFQSHISVLFFGFFEDDTKAVMKSVWTDYPLIRVSVFFVLLVTTIIYVISKIFKKSEPLEKLPSLKGATFLTVIVLLLFIIGLRGSLGTFPLQIDDTTISENNTINLLPMNGPFALKEAWLTRKHQMNIEGNIKWLKDIGYENQLMAVCDYYRLSSQSVKNNEFSEFYFKKTPYNDYLKLHPPNVIFFQMESMSNYNMGFHSKELNLLGHLEKYWNSEIVFKKCFPYGNGTINTLEGFLVNTPVTSLAQSNYRYISYKSSIANSFVKAGYETSYVTGGKLGWRNINEFIPKQNFKYVDGSASIKQVIPSAQECEWGIYDEYLFDFVFQKLANSKGKPQMIFAMTTTNHTPFTLPSHYKPYPVKISPELKSKLLTDEKMAISNFSNLQYSNDCLGRFLDKLKTSPYGDNTIVVATGDHNNLMLFEFKDNQLLEKRGVPLFMSVPEKYLEGHKIDTSLFVSHKDIFPTLINLALSDASYFNAGDFLFDKATPKENYFSIDLMSREAVNVNGAVCFDPDPTFFEWNSLKTELVKTSKHSGGLDSLLTKARSYYASMSFFIKSEIDKNKGK